MADAGFSLFVWKRSELIFVACILIATLAISFFQLRVGEMKTRDAQRRSDLDLVTRALEDYYGDHGVFPSASSDGLIISCGDKVDLACSWGGGPIRDLQGVVYLRQIPQDPFTYKGQHYVYESSSDNKHFKLYAALERHNDPAYKGELTITCGNNVQCNWYETN